MLVSPYILHLSMLEYEKQRTYGFGGIRFLHVESGPVARTLKVMCLSELHAGLFVN